MITYNAEGVKLPKIGKRDTTRWIKAVAATHNRKVGEIGYMFVDDEKNIGSETTNILDTTTTPTSLPSTIARATCSMATL